MNRRFLLLLFVAPVALAFALGGRPQAARADTSSIDWDVMMSVTQTGTGCANNGDANIDPGECPQTEAHFDVGSLSPSMGFFDMATELWKTGPPGGDLDGDGLAEPTDGLAKLSGEALGSIGGYMAFTLMNNLVTGIVSSGNNVDDTTGFDYDRTVAGQPPVCGLTQPGPGGGTVTTGYFNPPAFKLWAADRTRTNPRLVSYLDTDGDTIPQTREDNFSAGQDCMGTGGTKDGMPDAIDCTPDALPTIQAALGFPQDNYVDRMFGIANLPIFGTVVQPVDINFLYYNMVSDPALQGYIQIPVPLYPGLPLPDPNAAGYVVTQQTVLTCTPYTANVTQYGLSKDQAWPGYPASPGGTRLRYAVAAGGPYDLLKNKSAMEDWDGDTLPSMAKTNGSFDRCIIDPLTGSAAQDTDGDFLTGLCETLGTPTGLSYVVPAGPLAGKTVKIYTNGEGATMGPNVNNPEDAVPLTVWNTAPPWDSGQDVDHDGYLNEVDNCPIIADRDLSSPADGIIDYQKDSDADGVGDVCEMGLVGLVSGLTADAWNIPGDGQGYSGQRMVTSLLTNKTVGDQFSIIDSSRPNLPVGKFMDRDNLCSDPFTIPGTEPTFDTGRWCAGVDAISDARSASRPAPGPVSPGPDTNPPSVLGRQFADSNDNAIPDLLDYPASGPAQVWPAAPIDWPNIEYKDVKSDTDHDLFSDACEAFMGSDPLDSSSVPVYNHAGVTPYTPPLGDCDGDTILDATDPDPFTNLDPDADRDGCARSEESFGAKSTPAKAPGATAAGGVSYQDSAWYDFYDVPAPPMKGVTPGTYTGGYNGAVGTADSTSVNAYSSVKAGDPAYEADVNLNGVRDGLEYDRSTSPAPNPPWDAGPPDGAINTSDVLAVDAQSGLKCSLGSRGSPTPTPTATATPPSVGGIAELPALAGASPEEAGAPGNGSGSSPGGYAARGGGLAAAAVLITIGVWYARRRRLR